MSIESSANSTFKSVMDKIDLNSISERAEELMQQVQETQERAHRCDGLKEQAAQIDPKQSEQDRRSFAEIQQTIKLGEKNLNDAYKQLGQESRQILEELRKYAGQMPNDRDMEIALGIVDKVKAMAEKCDAGVHATDAKTKQALDKTVDKTVELASTVKDKAVEIASNQKQAASEDLQQVVDTTKDQVNGAKAAFVMVMNKAKEALGKVKEAFKEGAYHVAKAAYVDMDRSVRSINMAWKQFNLETALGAHSKNVENARIQLEKYQNLAKERAAKEHAGLGFANAMKKILGVKEQERPLRDYLSATEQKKVDHAMSILIQSNKIVNYSLAEYESALEDDIIVRNREMRLNKVFGKTSLNNQIMQEETKGVFDKVKNALEKMPEMKEFLFEGLSLQKGEGKIAVLDDKGKDATEKLLDILKQPGMQMKLMNTVRNMSKSQRIDQSRTFARDHAETMNMTNKEYLSRRGGDER